MAPDFVLMNISTQFFSQGHRPLIFGIHGGDKQKILHTEKDKQIPYSLVTYILFIYMP